MAGEPAIKYSKHLLLSTTPNSCPPSLSLLLLHWAHGRLHGNEKLRSHLARQLSLVGTLCASLSPRRTLVAKPCVEILGPEIGCQLTRRPLKMGIRCATFTGGRWRAIQHHVDPADKIWFQSATMPGQRERRGERYMTINDAVTPAQCKGHGMSFGFERCNASPGTFRWRCALMPQPKIFSGRLGKETCTKLNSSVSAR
jgi:hypothetical protein